LWEDIGSGLCVAAGPAASADDLTDEVVDVVVVVDGAEDAVGTAEPMCGATDH